MMMRSSQLKELQYNNDMLTTKRFYAILTALILSWVAISMIIAALLDYFGLITH